MIHAHDWQAGLLPVYARRQYRALWGGSDGVPPSVFTIHNIAYQGIIDKEWVPRLGLSWQDFHVNGLEFWDRLSYLKAGVKFSDVLTTVSPTYALEIQRPEYGYGFDGVMRTRAAAMVGILNGIDVKEWDPTQRPVSAGAVLVDRSPRQTRGKAGAAGTLRPGQRRTRRSSVR